MKRFYIIFIALCILFPAMLYLSIWWFLAGVAVCMIYIAYRFYAVRLQSMAAINSGMEERIEQLHVQLDRSIRKEEKTSKEAEQVREVKHQLLAIVSHEIRTPMNGLMGMTLLLAETSLTREQSEYTATIRSCGESLLTTVNDILVNDILNFSKLDQEGKQLENKEFDLRNCLEEVLDMFAVKAGAANLDLIYHIDENVPEQIIGDSKRLRQILMNLIENAIRFTTRGEVFVGIHLLRTGEDNKIELSFEVRDTGTGIRTDKTELLFKGVPGKDSPTSEEQENVGLGLVICKKLVEMMEGWIEVQSEPGKGATFTFCIRVSPGQRTNRNSTQDTMASLEGKHILIVDDNSTNRSVLIKQMATWKALPVAADSAKQAMEILSQQAGIDLVLTDMDMPGMDGMQLTKFIRNLYPAIPVILMNQAGKERYKQEPELFSSVLVKPVRQFLLRDHVLGVFSRTSKFSPDKQNKADKLSEDFSKQYPLNILVAEDNHINQKIAMKILTKLGYQPELAGNGKEVLELISHKHYDLILMDVQMPEMDGMEATRMLRLCLEIQPVVIAMTANVMQGDRDDCMQAGMDDYISKPIEMVDLLAQLEKWALVIRNKKH
jgi:signal transduction histidine kinase/DNA-binding response OmpR family regulator